MTDTKVCPTCEGEKYIYLLRIKQVLGKPAEPWHEVKKCPTCNGEGRVEG